MNPGAKPTRAERRAINKVVHAEAKERAADLGFEIAKLEQEIAHQGRTLAELNLYALGVMRRPNSGKTI